MGVKEEIVKHEEECIHNYNKRSCLTCKHAQRNFTKYTCAIGHDIPEGKYIEQCNKYEWDEKDNTTRNVFTGNLFGSLFGGL
jgi:hypothetical protein